MLFGVFKLIFTLSDSKRDLGLREFLLRIIKILFNDLFFGYGNNLISELIEFAKRPFVALLSLFGRIMRYYPIPLIIL